MSTICLISSIPFLKANFNSSWVKPPFQLFPKMATPPSMGRSHYVNVVTTYTGHNHSSIPFLKARVIHRPNNHQPASAWSMMTKVTSGKQRRAAKIRKQWLTAPTSSTLLENLSTPPQANCTLLLSWATIIVQSHFSKPEWFSGLIISNQLQLEAWWPRSRAGSKDELPKIRKQRLTSPTNSTLLENLSNSPQAN